jgi:hypothetical protein
MTSILAVTTGLGHHRWCNVVVVVVVVVVVLRLAF